VSLTQSLGRGEDGDEDEDEDGDGKEDDEDGDSGGGGVLGATGLCSAPPGRSRRRQWRVTCNAWGHVAAALALADAAAAAWLRRRARRS
jgi:hypothetical protein